ncbi:winged helix DNA-binding domain-containing protein [Pseudonocardia hispaniensis]|uniref:Winged helix DNA-binding domain-containing protein n=1 Tax=Pseudonocardia hispaniensis TaxID=904933 RepID=A0ABW1IX18_9PSEU
MRTFDVAERRARLARRHRLAPGERAPDVVSAADSVVCLHATDPATVYLSAWARVDGLVTAEVDKALYTDRSLVKHLCMRRTLFVLNTDLLGVVQAAAGERVAGQQRRRLIKEVEAAGLYADGAAWLAEASAATLDALDALGEASSTELRAAVPLLAGSTSYAPDKPYGGENPIGPRVLTTLSAAGKVLRGTNQGSWNVSRPRWVTTRRWLGHEPRLPTEAQARAELVRRWLYAFGPATVTDITWWLGSTLGATRAALADIGAVEVDLHGAPGVALADDLDAVAPVEPWAALLPGLDPTTMGWSERAWYLGPHRSRLFDRNGNGGATAWWDGRIVGGWNQTPTGEIYLQLLEDVGSEGLAALEAEAARLTEWLGGLRVAARFPSPLWTSSRARRTARPG